MTINRYKVGVSLTFAGECAGRFDELSDRLYEELLVIEDNDGGIVDPDMAVGLRDLTASVEMLVDAAEPVSANLCAVTAIRTALHAIGVGTPGWDLAIASITAETHRVSDLLQDA